jgi:hypothetical protein
MKKMSDESVMKATSTTAATGEGKRRSHSESIPPQQDSDTARKSARCKFDDMMEKQTPFVGSKAKYHLSDAVSFLDIDKGGFKAKSQKPGPASRKKDNIQSKKSLQLTFMPYQPTLPVISPLPSLCDVKVTLSPSTVRTNWGDANISPLNGKTSTSDIAVKVPVRYYADLMPLIHMDTILDCELSLEDTVDKVTTILKQQDISCKFTPSECLWTCAVLKLGSHCDISIRIFRRRQGHGASHAIEFQRMGGDTWIFRSIFSNFKAAFLSNNDIQADTTATFQRQSFESTTSYTHNECLEGEMECDSSLIPTMEDIKRVIISSLRYGGPSARTQGVQMASTIYSNLSPSESPIRPTDEDKALLLLLIQQAKCVESTTATWASQHALVSIANMTSRPEFCEQLKDRRNCAFIWTNMCRIHSNVSPPKEEVKTEVEIDLGMSSLSLGKASVVNPDCADGMTEATGEEMPDLKAFVDTIEKLTKQWSYETNDVVKYCFQILENLSKCDVLLSWRAQISQH